MEFNKKIIVKISNGENVFEEDATESEIEHWEFIEKELSEFAITKTFDWWVRPVKFSSNDLMLYHIKNENCHFIYSYIEAMTSWEAYLPYLPDWMKTVEEMTIEVYHK